MAATEDLLAHMEDLDDVLAQKDIASTSGPLQSRAIRALNRAQDYMETVIGGVPHIFASVDDSTSTTASQEYSDAPTRLKRIDSVWFVSSSTSRPTYELDPIRRSGGHRGDTPFPVFDTSNVTEGKPTAYWWTGEGTNRLYWDRDPDAAHTIRIVGFYAAADMSAGSTFFYPDELIIPVAAFANRIFHFRADKDMTELEQLAALHFGPAINQYRVGWRHQKDALRGAFPAH